MRVAILAIVVFALVMLSDGKGRAEQDWPGREWAYPHSASRTEPSSTGPLARHVGAEGILPSRFNGPNAGSSYPQSGPYTSFLPIIIKAANGESVPTPTPRPGRTYSWSDDFENPNSGWYIADSTFTRWSYQKGEYEMLLRGTYRWAWAAAPGPALADYNFRATVRRHSGTLSAYGLLFNLVSSDLFYFFLVQPDPGQFAIWKYESPNWKTLLAWTPSSSILTDHSTNRLSILRTGADVSLHINEDLVAACQSTSATGVRIGFSALSGSSAPVSLRFDNYSVTGTSDSVSLVAGQSTGSTMSMPVDLKPVDGVEICEAR